MRTRLAIHLVVLLFILTSCRSPGPSAGPTTTTDEGMDKSVQPGDDFYDYANGGWLKNTEIPPDKSSYGVFEMLTDESRKRTASLIQESANNASNASAEAKKVGDFYSSYMDEGAIESTGISRLKPRLDEIAGINDKKALARAIGTTLRTDVDPLNNTNFQTAHLFGIWISQGLTDPTRNYPYLLQGGLGMPDRDYYTSNDPHMVALRAPYKTHIAAIMKLAGLSNENDRASRVFDLETKMAGVHATRTESADVKLAVSWKREELTAKAPGLDWTTLLEAAALNEAPVFFVWHPKAVAGLATLVERESLDAWKDWLAFRQIEESGRFLPKAFVDEDFSFYGTALNGTPQLRPRWQRGIDYTNEALGEAVGKLYVDRYFPPEAKAKVMEMVADLEKAFGSRIDSLEWMSADTKQKAKEKLSTIRIGIGYPDKWKDYSSLEITKGDALGNAQRADLFNYRQQLAKLGKPVDRDEWWLDPQIVNALNLPLQNALNFPAAILQPPFFDMNADAANNYGSMGAVIGHEISHSFDDQGSQFDAEGRIANWWTKEDLDHFKAASEALAKQYDSYKPFPDLAVNGHLTLSENIADLAGLAAAYDAYHLHLNGAKANDQQFFISFEQSWRSKSREPALRNRITTDGHAPDQYRGATVRNLDPWYDAFAVKSGQAMYLETKDRVRVW
jgi:putative endopeptidase